jgi:hypothetical protein
MSDHKQEGKEEKGGEDEDEDEKPVYMSSPRKRLQQVRRQAQAIDEEVGGPPCLLQLYRAM